MKILTEQAIKLLESGAVIAIPTDTVYGLAVSQEKPIAINTLFELKKRPKSNPLVLFIRDINELTYFVEEIPTDGKAIMDAFWPGPLTLVLPAKNSSTIAIRIPNQVLILNLLKQTGPLFVTSANISGTPPLTTISDIEATFGNNFPVLDGKFQTLGTPSTILSFENNFWQIDRTGPISAEDLFPILGYYPKNKLTFTPNSA